MNRSSLLISICLIAIAAASCSDSSEKLELGGGCTLDSDCTNPLSCKFAISRLSHRSALRDRGQRRCLSDSGGSHLRCRTCVQRALGLPLG